MPEAARTSPRTAPKEERQLQLIKATIRSIARHGLADTTIATVARDANLSQGIINLHFRSKQGLLDATLEHLTEEYRRTWRKAFANAGPAPAERLAVLVDVDFRPPICERNKLAVWFAFWGESKARPTYRRICAAVDDEYRATVAEACDALIAKGRYADRDGATIARGLSAMCGGLWLGNLMNANAMDRAAMRSVVASYLAATFPRHFSSDGGLR